MYFNVREGLHKNMRRAKGVQTKSESEAICEILRIARDNQWTFYISQQGTEVFFLILCPRIFPFIPSNVNNHQNEIRRGILRP